MPNKPAKTIPKHELERLKGRSALIVEDSWHIADALADILTGIGMTIGGPASTLSAGLEMARNQPFDFAIVDLNLQGEMTFDLIDDLATRKVNVIVTTGYEDTSGIRNKDVPILTKPVDAVDLMRTMLNQL